MKTIIKIMDFFILPMFCIRGIVKFPSNLFIAYSKMTKNHVEQFWFLIQYLKIWGGVDIPQSMSEVFDYFATQEIDGVKKIKTVVNSKNQVIKTGINDVLIDMYNKIERRKENRPCMKNAIATFLSKQPTIKNQILEQKSNFKMCVDLQRRIKAFIEQNQLVLMNDTGKIDSIKTPAKTKQKKVTQV